MVLTFGSGLSEKSIVTLDGSGAPFFTIELEAGVSVTGRECAYA
jgi:hypothetical protein